MPAYIIVDVTIHNAENYEGYKKLTPASVAAYDGKFIVRGGKTETLEGNWQPGRFVVLQFPSVERAKEWWAYYLKGEKPADWIEYSNKPTAP